MKRDAIKYLYEWKSRANHKPMIVRGARQVGKTWLMRAFAEEAYVIGNLMSISRCELIARPHQNNVANPTNKR